MVEGFAGLRSSGAVRIYRSAPAATDCHCHWIGSPARAGGPSVRFETGGGAIGVLQVLTPIHS